MSQAQRLRREMTEMRSNLNDVKSSLSTFEEKLGIFEASLEEYLAKEEASHMVISSYKEEAYADLNGYGY